MLNKRTGLREYDSVAESMDGEGSKLSFFFCDGMCSCRFPYTFWLCCTTPAYRIFVKQMLSKFGYDFLFHKSLRKLMVVCTCNNT